MDSRAASTGTRPDPAPDPSITARLKLVTSRTPFPWAGLDPRVNDARLHTTKIRRPDVPQWGCAPRTEPVLLRVPAGAPGVIARAPYSAGRMWIVLRPCFRGFGPMWA